VSDPSLWHDDYEQFLEDVVKPVGLTYAQFVEKGYLKGPDRLAPGRRRASGPPRGRWN
jgi:hypothetical protein